MSDLNNVTALKSSDAFVIKDSNYPSFKYLTVAGFQSEVKNAVLLQESLLSVGAVPLVIAPFDNIETLVFLDFVSSSNTMEIDLPAAMFQGQKVNISINVLSGTALTTIVVKDDTGATLYTLAATLTVGFVAEGDLVWKQL